MLARLSIRWRLALISAALTFAILTVFGMTAWFVTSSRVKSDFNNGLLASVGRLTENLKVEQSSNASGAPFVSDLTTNLADVASSDDDAIRVLNQDGREISSTANAPEFPSDRVGSQNFDGYRVETRRRPVQFRNAPDVTSSLLIQYGRKTSAVDSTLRRIRIFLVLGVLAGTGLALGGGMLLARRAMKPIAELTEMAGDIATTRDLSRRIPPPASQDEVGVLASTLEEMLESLEQARTEREAAFASQRQFIADASHELRTPLTSVLANLELLADTLEGEQGESARSALRSSRRMRRLVADLLLLARADAKRPATRVPVDLSQMTVDAAAELWAVSDGHELTLETEEAVVDGDPDDLLRLALNLMENAVHHTPPGTRIDVSVKPVGTEAVLTVADDGPGISDSVRDTLFDRFVRNGENQSSSFGLGLSIVQAVTQSHAGRVEVQQPSTGGTKFVVRLPLA